MIRYDYQYYAYRDKIAAVGSFKLDIFDSCCVHSGQSIEKYLKSVCKYALLDKPELLKIHSCRRLAFELLPIFPEFNELLIPIKLVSDYYFTMRYPNEDPIVATKEMAQDALNLLSKVEFLVLAYHQKNGTLDTVEGTKEF